MSEREVFSKEWTVSNCSVSERLNLSVVVEFYDFRESVTFKFAAPNEIQTTDHSCVQSFKALVPSLGLEGNIDSSFAEIELQLR
jgi:hypothetical protein